MDMDVDLDLDLDLDLLDLGLGLDLDLEWIWIWILMWIWKHLQAPRSTQEHPGTARDSQGQPRFRFSRIFIGFLRFSWENIDFP